LYNILMIFPFKSKCSQKWKTNFLPQCWSSLPPLR